MENFQILIIVFMACLQTAVMSHFLKVGEAQCWFLILKLTWILEKALMVSVILGQKNLYIKNLHDLESLRIVGYTDILKEAVFCIWPYRFQRDLL